MREDLSKFAKLSHENKILKSDFSNVKIVSFDNPFETKPVKKKKKKKKRS